MKWIYFTLIISSVVFADNNFVIESIDTKANNWTFTMKNNKAVSGASNDPIKYALGSASSLDKSVLHVKIVDKDNARWEAPVVNPESGKRYKPSTMDQMGFDIKKGPFTFGIKADGEVLVQSIESFGYNDKHLEIGLKYSGNQIMGIGERVTNTALLCQGRNRCSYATWPKDGGPFDDGNGGCRGSYGHQPFYLIQTKSKKFFGVFALNSNNQEDIIDRFNDGSMKVTHHTAGGIFDFYFFYPGTADSVVKLYHEFIGRPYLIPLWSLGYHQCRYGWRDLNKVKEVVSKFEQNDLPLDTVWGDIDYMKDYADFTVDDSRYGGLGDFVKELHQKKMHWVPIIDAGLKYDPNDKYFKKGEAKKLFIKSAKTKQTLRGKVWPGPAVFISWYHPDGPALWKEGLSDLFEKVQFDGIWLDMNEIANFCHGECGTIESEKTSMLRRTLSDGGDPHDPREFEGLPYRAGNCDLEDKTISMSAYHYSDNDFDDRTRKEFNTHSLWALFEAKATHEFLAEKRKERPFVLTRANFAGSQTFTTKWLGDNYANWDFMRHSIAGVFHFQLFGFSLVGSDMCGFMGDTNEELCGRWMQLGAFYPFTRNHNDIHSRDQEPYVFGEKVITATKNAMRQKYSIMIYYYSKIFEVSLDGGVVFHPLFFDYPNDEETYKNNRPERSFMIGPALLVVPELEQGQSKVKVYCPNENWYNLKDFSTVSTFMPGETLGKEYELEADFKYVNVLFKGGNVISYQDTKTVRRIAELSGLPMNLLIAPGSDKKATGTLVFDDGISLKTIEEKKYRRLQFDFDFAGKVMNVKTLNQWEGPTTKSEAVDSITIFGAKDWASINKACAKGASKSVTLNGSYDNSKGILTFKATSSDAYWKDITSVQFGSGC